MPASASPRTSCPARVHVKGDASQSAAATGHGGLVVIDGNAGARCGISMKGVDIVVGGNIGHMSAFMAQAGRLVVCGDAGEALGDSIYEARHLRQGHRRLPRRRLHRKADAAEHLAELGELLAAAGRTDDPADFKRYGSARNLYHFTSTTRRRTRRHAMTITSCPRTRSPRPGPSRPAHRRAGPARIRHLRPRHHRGHPAGRRHRHLRHPRLGRQAQGPALR